MNSDTILIDIYGGRAWLVSVKCPVGRARRDKTDMGIVGTVDSRYKRAVVRVDGAWHLRRGSISRQRVTGRDMMEVQAA